MTTEDLISALARSPEPAHAKSILPKFSIAVTLGLILGIALQTLTLGMRADIEIFAAAVSLKIAFSGLLAILAGGFAVRLAKPTAHYDAPFRRHLATTALVVAMFVSAGLITLLLTEPSARAMALTGGKMPWCVVLIPLFGVPTFAFLTALYQEAAPTRLVVSGASIGALSGGIGAMIYATACPIDSVAFVTIWYSVAIAIAALLGALIGPKFLRW